MTDKPQPVEVIGNHWIHRDPSDVDAKFYRRDEVDSYISALLEEHGEMIEALRSRCVCDSKGFYDYDVAKWFDPDGKYASKDEQMQAQLDRCCGGFPKPPAKPRPKTGIEREADDRLEQLHEEYKYEFWGGTMSERPIIFSAPMVRAVLEGRKTQTRRIVKPKPVLEQGNGSSLRDWSWKDGNAGPSLGEASCPFGYPGDRLWVREGTIVHASIREQLVGYMADGCRITEGWMKVMQSIHMRRVHSRVTLEIIEVRVERLQDISEEDALAEGCEREFQADGSDYGAGLTTATENFFRLWESIHGLESWNANPWVWVVEFRRLT